MGAVKNMVRGTIYSVIYAFTTIIIPILTFSWLFEMTVQGFPLNFEQQQYQDILFWTTSLGLVIVGCAFFQYSSPKQSIRRGIFALIQVLVNCLYIWSYKFSGATNIEFIIQAFIVMAASAG